MSAERKNTSSVDYAYLAGPVRTPIGGFQGGLRSVSAPRLGAAVVRESLRRAGVDGVRGGAVEEVIMGNVIGAGLGQNVARQCAMFAGLPVSVGATTVNRVCGSGLKSVMLAAQALRLGDADVVVAGGTESMSRAPYLLERARDGYRLGDGTLVDSLIRDGLWDVYNGCHMGTCGDATAADFGFSRADQDDYAIESYRRAIAAAERQWTSAEIVPVDTTTQTGSGKAPAGRGGCLDADEEPRRFDPDKLRALQPAFSGDGTVTAGNASSINDGAAAVTVLSQAGLDRLQITPVARILGYATYSAEPEKFTTAPVGALRRLFERVELAAGDFDVFEINEAFAVVPLVAMRELDLPHDRVNPLGGAVALGHPIGASGARTLVTLLNALRVRKEKRGAVCLCVGGGEAVAMAVERMELD